MKWRACRTILATTTLVLVALPAAAASQPLINYFQPMPVVGKLSTTVWGSATVGKRDPANGLEDNGANGGVDPQRESYFYWDGKILKGEDGKYHMYASRWQYSKGFGPPAGGGQGTGWDQSIPAQAISDNVMGPYVIQGNPYSKNLQGSDLGHNVTALVTPTGTTPFTLSVGEIIPGQMFNSSSANGPWALLGATQTNNNGHNNCGVLSSNFTFTVGPDKRFWATSRSGCVMDSDQVQGPYKVETDSILPNLEKNDNGNAEDQVIWYSGGYYHIVYNYWNVQRAYHIMSKDGKTKWASTGLAYQGTQSPSNANSRWLRYADGTVNQWHNMERPGVYEENGHVTHFTFAVTDVDKNASGVNRGGSKVIVVPFNGVQFDCDNGDAASCAELSGSGAGGSGAGGAASGGSAGGGTSGSASGGSAGALGGTGGAPSNNGGDAPEGIAGLVDDAGGATGAVSGSSGSMEATAGAPVGIGGSAGSSNPYGVSGATAGQPPGSATTPPDDTSGCSCRLGGSGSNRDQGRGLGLFVAAALATRLRRKRAA